MNLKKIITETEKNPIISKWSFEFSIHPPFDVYLNNKDGNHGYFKLLDNIVSSLKNDATIVELGNREGMGILAIYNSLKTKQKFISIDIINDCRFVPKIIREDKRVIIDNNFNSLDSAKIKNYFRPKQIDLLFFDTIHTYEQIKQEYELWQSYMSDECIFLIDDIRDIQEDRSKWKFHEEVTCSEKYDITDWGHARTGFGVYKK